jgi:hypothetical protein
MEATNAMTGCGLRRYSAEYIYREHYPLKVFLKSWGDDHLLIILDGHVIGLVRRDRRSMWVKLKERTLRWWYQRKPNAETSKPDQEVTGNGYDIANADLVRT